MIYRRFQFTLVALNAGLITFLFAVFLLFQWRSYAKLVQMGEQAHLSANHPFFQLLELQMGSTRFYMSVAYGVALVLGCFLTLVASHKLAGPIVRMKGFFTRIANQGKVTEKISFRRGDFFRELPAEINRALEAIARKS